MYITKNYDAATSAARFRMPELFLESASGAFVAGRVAAGVGAFIGAPTPATVKAAHWGVPAWRPPA